MLQLLKNKVYTYLCKFSLVPRLSFLVKKTWEQGKLNNSWVKNIFA